MNNKYLFNFLILLTIPLIISLKNVNKNDYYIKNQYPLKSTPYSELPLGSIKPNGWLKNQLEIMANGMTGNLDSVFSKVIGERNGWLGGDGDGWERGPYWVDGLLPLAYLLDDKKLIEKTKPWIEWSLNNQQENGYFGPIPFEKEPIKEQGLQKVNRRDWWPHMVMLKVLKQYYMATNDKRVIELMTNYFKYQLKELPKTPLDNWTYWANRRGGDNLMIVYWLYNITKEPFLLELGEILYEQTHPWTDHFLKGTLIDHNSFHCVNLAQGMKQPIIYYQKDSDEKYIKAVKKALSDLKKYHGQPQGMYGADEHLHGNNPNQGSEFCSSVELMFSLEKMLTITGDTQFADHLELITFNALPTQASDDFNTRQYFQSANQVKITRANRNFEWNHGHKQTDAVFGKFTGYPCCTSNMHQGWPKFTQNLWYSTDDNGLAALVYSPSTVTAKVSDGVDVQFTETTNYPFDNKIRFSFESKKNVKFPFHLRIPQWCKNPVLKINGKKTNFNVSNQIIKINRKWKNGDFVELELPMEISISRWYENSLAVERGPLVYALKIDEEWKKITNKKDPEVYGEYYYEVYPKSDWNYGILYNYETGLNNYEIIKKKFTDKYPWNIKNAPIEIKVAAKKINEWKIYNDTPGPIPYSHPWEYDNPGNSTIVNNFPSKEPIEIITLIPYGCTTLRISEFPIVR